MQPDPMKTMKSCRGGSCNSVPDEVYEAVYESLSQIPGPDRCDPLRDARAEILAPLMAKEGWRFCPCYPALRSKDHARIFDLVHTNLANRLALKATLENAA
jgi:hypothetical protein